MVKVSPFASLKKPPVKDLLLRVTVLHVLLRASESEIVAVAGAVAAAVAAAAATDVDAAPKMLLERTWT
jgi:hypothetical protein